MPLEVKVYEPLKKTDDKLKKIADEVPQPIMRWILVGASFSGKSNIIKNIILNKKWGYRDYYDEIYIWCGSADDLEEYERYTQAEKINKKCEFIDKYEDEAVHNLYDEIEQSNIKSKNPSRVLFIFDDQIMNNISRINKMNTMDRIFVAGRHANISCIVATQKYTALNQNMRKLNCTAISVMNGTNKQEMEAVAKDHCSSYNPDEFLRAILDNTKDRYSFVTIDIKREFKDRLRDNTFEPISVGNSKVEEVEEDVEEEDVEDKKKTK